MRIQLLEARIETRLNKYPIRGSRDPRAGPLTRYGPDFQSHTQAPQRTFPKRRSCQIPNLRLYRRERTSRCPWGTCAFDWAAPPLGRGNRRTEGRLRPTCVLFRCRSSCSARKMNMNVRPAALRRRPNNRTPNRYEIDEIASELVVLYGGVIMQDAQRYSLCRADAEDAYQRALEILVTKAPTTDPEHLVPWIRTVVRREAVAIAKSTHNQRSVSFERSADAVARAESVDALPDERVDVISDLEVGNEALKRISRDQVRCLLAQAEGLTYDEIAEVTGFSQRKVSRCINDGRQAFLKKVDAIESGSECDRVQPLLHQLIDGDADAAVEARPHLSSCASCRSRLHSYRRAPKTTAAYFPPAVVLVHPFGGVFSSAVSHLRSLLNERLATVSYKTHQWSELSLAKKLSLGIGLTAAAVGGGVAAQNEIRDAGRADQHPSTPAADSASSKTVSGERLTPARKSKATARESRRTPRTRRSKTEKPSSASKTQTRPPPSKGPAPVNAPSTPVDDGSSEFLPEAR